MVDIKQSRFILVILLVTLMLTITGCIPSNMTPNIPTNADGDEVILRTTYTEIALNEGVFSLEVCSLNKVGLNAAGFSYYYFDSDSVEITDLSNYIGIPFYVDPSTLLGTPGPIAEVNDIPLYFNEVENYFIDHPDIKQISCTVYLVGTDTSGNEINKLVMSDIPIIENGVELQEVNAIIQTTPAPPTGEMPFTVNFDGGASTTEDARGIAKYCWNFGDGTTEGCSCSSCTGYSAVECPTHTYEEAGSYVVTLCVWDYNDNLDCAAVLVNVTYTEMNMIVTANPATISPGDSSLVSAYLTDQYNNPVPEGTTVAFYTDNGTLSTNFTQTDTDGFATVDLTLNEPVLATVSAVCGDTSGSIAVKSVALDMIVTANPATISPGDSSTISAYLVDDLGEPIPDGTIVAFSTDEGTLSDNFAVTTDGIATVTLVLDRISTATVTASYGSMTGSAMVNCVVAGRLVASFNYLPSSPVFIGEAVQFDATDSFSDCVTGITSYSWDFDLENPGVHIGTGLTSGYTYTDTGIYTVQLTIADGCGKTATSTMDVVVTAPAAPLVDIEVLNIDGLTVNVSGADSTTGCPGGMDSYSWAWGDNTSDGSGQTSGHTFSATGVYTIQLTVMDACGKSSQATVDVNLTAPAAPLAAIEIVEIDGLTVNLSGADSTTGCPGGMDTYTWNWGETPAVSDGSGMTTGHTFPEAGVYTIALEVMDACGKSSQATVDVNLTAPAAPLAAIEIVEIDGLTVNLSGADSTTGCAGGIADYGWYYSDISGGSGMTTGHTFDSAGVYTIELTVTDTCGKTSQATVDVNLTAPNLPFADIEVIEVDGLTVNVSGADSTTGCPGKFEEYVWDWRDGSPISYSMTSGHTYTTSGIHTIQLVVIDVCGKSSMATVDVNLTAPAAPLAAIEILSIDDFTINVSGADSTTGCPGGIVTYEWDWDDVTSDGSGMTSGHTYAASGIYTVQLTVTDACGLSSTATVDVNLSAPALADIEIVNLDAYEVNVSGADSTTGCANQLMTYTWDWGDGRADGYGETSNHIYTEADIGIQTITLTVTDACGESSQASVDIDIYPYDLPVAKIDLGTVPNPEQPDGSVQIDVSGENSTTGCPGGISDYTWDWGDGTAEGSGSTTNHTYAPGAYTMQLTVQDDCGKTSFAEAEIIISEP